MLSCGRVLQHDMELGGYQLKKGEMVWINLYALHTSDINFQHPKDFLPERWLPEEVAGAGGQPGLEQQPGPEQQGGHSARASLTGNTALPHKSTMFFSDGHRSCVGKNLAYLSARTVLLVRSGGRGGPLDRWGAKVLSTELAITPSTFMLAVWCADHSV